MNIIYLTHKSMNSDRGIIVDTKNSLNSELVNSIFTNGEFKCDEEINYNKKTITIENEDRIIIPISENKSIILKQMDTINHHQTMDMFPYNTFSEINVFENNDPISILFAHLYYNFYNGNQTFEDIINECCDIIDYSFTPNCKNYSKIKIKVSDCEGKDNMRTIEYLNCKTNNDTDFYTKIKCDYISYTNFKGIIIIVVTTIAFLIELYFLSTIIIHRKERCIYVGGLYFLVCLILSSIILDVSVFYWFGKYSKRKCIIKFWTIIIGVRKNT
ncbi:hypothetical protein BCR32DRAFT_245899 [Anaeromyces robustus]|uniref:G-protein coupled receptors family 3 profile domain-containing protein n=1 Tax=Anaeromyces robustus TaxID=1754192 RepID=A0A1Y1X2J0_9FUNG|nr:hypothetical protein BCR32DRAFT_245899 [Anaeromyces robustus]|eukprot:ORX80019.1 hypothetical protein BCR32DRAFT_245899 [Anaeromyces robustus]